MTGDHAGMPGRSAVLLDLVDLRASAGQEEDSLLQQMIEHLIGTVLGGAPPVDAWRLDVRVRDRFAVVSGRLPGMSERRAVLRAVECVSGIDAVAFELDIGPG